MAPQIVEVELANVDAADADRSALDVVEAQQQTRQRGLAGAGVADDGDGFAGFDAETHVAQHPVLVFVGEPDVIEFDGRRAFGKRRGAGAATRSAAGVSSSLKTRSLAAMARLQDVVFVAQILNGAEETQAVLKERDQHAERQMRRADPEPSIGEQQGQREHAEKFHHRIKPAVGWIASLKASMWSRLTAVELAAAALLRD